MLHHIDTNQTFMDYTTRKTGLLLILPAFILLMLTGCGGGDESGNGTTSKTDVGDVRVGGTYRLNVLRGDPNGLDPVLIDSKHASDIASQIYDYLVDLDDSLRIVPELASSWDMAEDGSSITFHLRTDVYFQDQEFFEGGTGRKMTAQDVKYSLTRCCDPRELSKAFWAFDGKVKGANRYFDAALANRPIEEVTGFVAVDDSTFRIDLIEPYAPFIYVLVNSFAGIVPHEAVEKYGRDFARHPVGTGPFRFDHWAELQEVVLTRNPNYWGEDEHGRRYPYVDTVQFTFVKDDNAQFSNFIAGALDELSNIPTEQFGAIVNPETMELQGEYTRYRAQNVPAMLTWYFAFNNTKKPFTDANVRRAFNYAVDKNRIVHFVLKNSPYAPADHGLTPPAFPDYPIDQIEGYPFNAQKARELLAAAGYPEGTGFPEVDMYIYDEPRLRTVAEALQAQLVQNLNVKINIKQVTFPIMMQMAEGGQVAFWGTRWYGDYPDPETYLNLLNGQIVPDDPTLPSTPNTSRYDSPEYNNLFNDAMKTIDYLARMSKYQKAEQLAMDDAPILPLFYDRHFRLLQPDVRGLQIDPMARYDLKKVWFDREDHQVANTRPTVAEQPEKKRE